MKKLLSFTFILCAFFFNILTSTAQAEYPDKPIKMIVMANPGGGTDIFARLIAPMLTKELGENIIVVNQPGGGGNLAANTLVKGKKDGYTLALLGEDVLGLNYVSFNVQYDYEDLIPISLVGGTPFGFYANGKSPWNDFNDVVKTAKEENRPIKVAVFDTKARYILDSLSKAAGIKFIYIPTQSASTALTAVLGNHAELSVIGAGVSDSIVAGKTKLIGSLAKDRFPKVPNQPTILEQGFDFKPHTSYVFIYAPKGVPEEVLVTLEKAIANISKTEEFKKALETVSFSTPTHLGRENAQKYTKAGYDFAMQIKAEKEKK